MHGCHYFWGFRYDVKYEDMKFVTLISILFIVNKLLQNKNHLSLTM